MISVAIATYNGEKYLREQLRSIEVQTVKPDEVIICDDCSTDNTISILEEFKVNAPFSVIILRNENNLGYKKNFKKVVNATHGDFVFLCDQDDYWFENKIERVLAVFKEKPEIQLIAHDAICTNDKLEPSKITLFTALKRDISSVVNGCVTCLRRSFLDTVKDIPDEFAFDSWFTHVANAIDVRFSLCEVLSYYRRHDEAVTINALSGKSGVIYKIKQKLVHLKDQTKNARTITHFEEQHCKTSLLLKYLQNLNNKESLPEWVSKELLEEKCLSLELIENSFQERLKAFSLKGFDKFKQILRTYKSGAYKHFHGFRTAIDDLFRF